MKDQSERVGNWLEGIQTKLESIEAHMQASKAICEQYVTLLQDLEERLRSTAQSLDLKCKHLDSDDNGKAA